jgi:hypothetical protein
MIIETEICLRLHPQPKSSAESATRRVVDACLYDPLIVPCGLISLSWVVFLPLPVVFHSVELPITLMLHLSVFHCLGPQDSGPDATSFLSAYLPGSLTFHPFQSPRCQWSFIRRICLLLPCCTCLFFVALNSKTLALTPPRLWALISDPSGNLNRHT